MHTSQTDRQTRTTDTGTSTLAQTSLSHTRCQRPLDFGGTCAMGNRGDSSHLRHCDVAVRANMKNCQESIIENIAGFDLFFFADNQSFLRHVYKQNVHFQIALR
jgi:hypothetical protein